MTIQQLKPDHTGFGTKSQRVLEAINDGEWHNQRDCLLLPYVWWTTINKMLAIGLIEQRISKSGSRQYRIATETAADFGDLWIE